LLKRVKLKLMIPQLTGIKEEDYSYYLYLVTCF
jgi:hypothetical protein